MEEVLGDTGTYATRTGFVLSQPGSKAQYWHRDTDTLQRHGTDGRFLVDVDDFYFTGMRAPHPRILRTLHRRTAALFFYFVRAPRQ
jgi:hypothetical protein